MQKKAGVFIAASDFPCTVTPARTDAEALLSFDAKPSVRDTPLVRRRNRSFKATGTGTV